VECQQNEHLLNTHRKSETHKSNIIDNMQHKHILLASKAKHSLTYAAKSKLNHVVRR